MALQSHRRLAPRVEAYLADVVRADLLSGEPGRIFGVPSAQVWFVDRVTIPSIVATAVTVWGEELLNQVPLLPIRRLDVGKALFAHSNQVLFSAGLYPLLPSATRYAMDALKRSVHNCYFSHHGRPAMLSEEAGVLSATTCHFKWRRHERRLPAPHCRGSPGDPGDPSSDQASVRQNRGAQ